MALIIDPLAIATSGYLDSNGNANPITIATDGYIVEIEEVDDGFIIKPRRPKKKPLIPGGGGDGGVDEGPDIILRKLPSIDEEEEEILAIINVFLKYGVKRLFNGG